jgi:hypothetical protein
MSQTKTAKASTGTINPSTARKMSYRHLSSGKFKIRAFFNVMFSVDNSISSNVSPGRCKHSQVKNIIDAMLAWMSFQAKCFNEKRNSLQSLAGYLYGSLWESNKAMPIGLFYNHNQKHIRLCYYREGVTEKEILENSMIGETIVSVLFEDSLSAYEFIKCLYDACGCEVGHEDVCPVYNFGVLLKEHDPKKFKEMQDSKKAKARAEKVS